MRNVPALIATVLLFFAADTTTVIPFAQTHEFTLNKTTLDNNTKGTPILEGKLIFQDSPPEKIINLPPNFSNIAYTSIAITPDSSLIGLRGASQQGRVRYFFDRNHNLDFSDEVPIDFTNQGDVRIARIPIRYTFKQGGDNTIKRTELSLYERSPGRIEYHFNELWEATLAIGSETLKVALQRWPILFIDNNFSGTYDKFFSTTSEVLALGGKFFRVRPDFFAEKLILEETDRAPVDQGYPAPGLDVHIWNSDKTFNLSDHKDMLTVLTFWSPLCSGSRGEAASYSQLAEEFGRASSVTFLAVTNDEAALKDYLKDNPHHFQHVSDLELWDIYGVTAPFVTFLIDADGKILKRYFQYSAAIREEIYRWLREGPSNGDENPNASSQDPRRQKAYVFADSSYTYADIPAADLHPPSGFTSWVHADFSYPAAAKTSWSTPCTDIPGSTSCARRTLCSERCSTAKPPSNMSTWSWSRTTTRIISRPTWLFPF